MNPIDLLSLLRKLLNRLQQGDKSRAKLITSVNDLSSAIASAATLTAMRLNQSLLAKTKKQKFDILISLSENELQAHAHMNNLCAPITTAARDLKSLLSKTNLNRNIRKKAELEQILFDLEHGERGLQQIMTDTFSMDWELKSKTKNEIDDYARERLRHLEKLAKEAQRTQFAIKDVI